MGFCKILKVRIRLMICLLSAFSMVVAAGIVLQEFALASNLKPFHKRTRTSIQAYRASSRNTSDFVAETSSNLLKRWQSNSSLANPCRTDQPFHHRTNACKLWMSSCVDWSKQIEPRIKLDSKRFLYPAVFNGPSNQVIQFWQAVYAAIRLNRTLVVPTFFTHKPKPSLVKMGKGVIPAHQRIDVNRIRRFVSSVSVKNITQVCGESFDVAFEPKRVSYDYINMIETVTGTNISFVGDQKLAKVSNATSLRVLRQNHDLHPNIPTLPRDDYSQSGLPPDGEKLRKIFNTPARCAVYMAPHYGIRISPPNDQIYHLPLETVNSENIENMSDKQLYSAVVDAVQLSPCIIEAAEAYIREAMNGSNFVGVHWRYDKHDWKAFYCKRQKMHQSFCNDLELITFEDIASAIMKSMKGSSKFQKNQLLYSQSYMYIAVPPSLKTFKKKLIQVILLANYNFVFPSIDLESFLTENFQTCWKTGKWTDTNEILSLTEMQLMVESEWFFFSELSTWSGVIRPKRLQQQNGNMVKKFEAPVYQLSRSQMLQSGSSKQAV